MNLSLQSIDAIQFDIAQHTRKPVHENDFDKAMKNLSDINLLSWKYQHAFDPKNIGDKDLQAFLCAPILSNFDPEFV